MEPPPPAADRRESLLGRIARVRVAGGSWWPAVALAVLIAGGPGVTIVAAALLADRVRSETFALEREEAPRLAAVRVQEAARAELRPLLARPGMITMLDGLARALPQDASVASASADAGGALRVEVLAPDPDRLRAALRRDPATAGLRNTGQRRGDGGMLVALERLR